MLTNGQWVVVAMAVAHLDDPLVRRHERALVLGAFREDSGVVPFTGIVYPYLSLTHFYRPGLPGGLLPFVTAGPRLRIEQFFRRALREHREGRHAAAFVALGRAMHLLADMGCPTHAKRVVHTTDPYEWYVEGNAGRLRELPVADVPAPRRARDLVTSLASFTQAFPADRTHSAWGHVMWRLGKWKRADRESCRAQAEAIIPVAAGHAVALLRLFLGTVAASPDRKPLRTAAASADVRWEAP